MKDEMSYYATTFQGVLKQKFLWDRWLSC